MKLFFPLKKKKKKVDILSKGVRSLLKQSAHLPLFILSFFFFFPIYFISGCAGPLLLHVSYLLPDLDWQLSVLFSSWSESCPWPKIPNTPLCHSPVWKLAKAPFSLFLCPFSFLADLMDNSELIRNVTLCGHLHHGKVSRLLATWNRGALHFCSFFSALRVTCWGLRPEGWTSWLWGPPCLLWNWAVKFQLFLSSRWKAKPLACLSLVSTSGQKRGNWALLWFWFYKFLFPGGCLSKKDFIFHLKIILWLHCWSFAAP